jgi:hypothetical protein
MPAKPPFSAEVSVSSTSYTPAAFRDEHYMPCRPTADIARFLQEQLSVERLNKTNKDLWFAGRPMPPRPLNYQVPTSRNIAPDERIDMHMVWEHSAHPFETDPAIPSEPSILGVSLDLRGTLSLHI